MSWNSNDSRHSHDACKGIEITEKHTNEQFKQMCYTRRHFGRASNDEGDGVGKIIADGALGGEFMITAIYVYCGAYK
uniref:Uncharacterized protein n=1 Tax=Glossina palpalis gambiensis TaxID=67801 RepID=A0A1B0AW81_9MUSC